MRYAAPNYRMFLKYPIRACRSLHECRICGMDIKDGQQYYDGGLDRRAHIHCIPKKTP